MNTNKLKRSGRIASVVNKDFLGKELVLMGWCHKQRDLGNLIFITLRDVSGEVQLVVNSDSPEELLKKASSVRSEYVLACKGTLRERSSANPDMPTGKWELLLEELEILSESETPPFYIESDVDAKESLRLEYRYLDLRRPVLRNRLIFRHKVAMYCRNWFDQRGFTEIETPTLIKSTPEGARDYLVPSRIFPGSFFALPQSPQIYKQLCMLAGFDRYMQFARCYRDEDLRADRQPEFTQIDLEMSFVDEEDVLQIMESFVKDLFKDIMNYEIKEIPRISWEQAMLEYGSDKPDLRFGMKISDLSEKLADSDFVPFAQSLADKGVIRAFRAKGAGQLSRRNIDKLSEIAKEAGLKGMAYIINKDGELKGPLAKVFDAAKLEELFPENEEFAAGLSEGDGAFFFAGSKMQVATAAGRLRLSIAETLEIPREKKWAFAWVRHFPMFMFDEEEQRFVAEHHPFTAPLDEERALLDSDPSACHAKAYDMVLNGNEIGGGSIRIHERDLQAKIFELIGMPHEEAEKRFGFLLKALKYGVPPHGGIAFGYDRMIMLMCESKSIKDVIAFPKVQNSSSLMAKCPARVDPAQLEELGLSVVEKESD